MANTITYKDLNGDVIEVDFDPTYQITVTADDSEVEWSVKGYDPVYQTTEDWIGGRPKRDLA